MLASAHRKTQRPLKLANATGRGVSDEIRAAFQGAVSQKGDDIVDPGPDKGERDEIRNAFAAWNWETIPKDVLLRDPLALNFMSPQGFRLFLPAYMLLTLSDPNEAGVHLDSVVFQLMPRAGTAERLRERLTVFSRAELKAIRNYLAFTRNAEALDFELGDYDAAIKMVEERLAVATREDP